ncbi:MAG: thiolase family protein [Clostridia bacterium]|nr:thiolase family protein [Clostridia bacterium]
MRKVMVLGIGQSSFGKFPDKTATELGTVAAKAAVHDAGIDPRMLQVAYGARAVDGSTTVQDILKNLGVTEIEMNNIENACGSGISAANLLWRDIATGSYDIGIVVGTEAMTTSSLAGKLLAPNKDDLDGQLGITMPSYFALIARRLMADYGATAEDLTYPSVKNHRNGCLNQYSMYKKELSAQEILESKMIADPITLLQCCPSTDGAAALILCSEAVARKYTSQMIQIRSSAMISGSFDEPGRDLVGFKMLGVAANKAYEMAGLGPEDVNVVELHDAFSPEEIWAYEGLGLCRKGEAISFMRSGAVDINGRIPVNPSGGLLALGHPLGASGVRVVCEIALQLRGDAGAHQVAKANVGVAEMIGGYLEGLCPPIAGGVQILTR